MERKKIKISEVSELLDIQESTLRIGMQHGGFRTLGEAFRGRGKSYIYYISPPGLAKYLGIEEVELWKKIECLRARN